MNCLHCICQPFWLILKKSPTNMYLILNAIQMLKVVKSNILNQINVILFLCDKLSFTIPQSLKYFLRFSSCLSISICHKGKLIVKNLRNSKWETFWLLDIRLNDLMLVEMSVKLFWVILRMVLDLILIKLFENTMRVNIQ